MTTANTNVIAKVAAVVAGLGLVAMSFAPVAQAQTSSADMQAQIASLLAQIEALKSSSTGDAMMKKDGEAMMFKADLTLNSTGAEVTALQNWLIGKGFAISAGATGFFGAQTKAALAAWQAANGVSPASGYFGPITRAKVNAMGGAMTGGNTGGSTGGNTGGSSNGDLNGGESSFEDLNATSGTDDDVSEGGTGEVAEFEFDVEDGDAVVDRLDLSFETAATGAQEDEPWDTFETVTIKDADGKELASEDVSDENDWLEDDNEPYVFRFSGLDYVVRENDMAKLIVEVEAQTGVDGTESADIAWTIYADDDGVRGTDSEDVEQYIGDADESVTFDVQEEGSDDDLSVRRSTDDPDSTTIEVEDDSTSEFVTIFAFDLDSDEDSGDVEVKEIPVVLTTSGTSTAFVVNDVRLLVDGEEFDDFTRSSATTATTTYTFDTEDEDFIVDAGERAKVEVQVEFRARTNANYPDGQRIFASVDGSAIDAEGDDDVNIDGSATSDTHTLRDQGVNVEVTDDTATTITVDGTDNDTATFTLKVDVEAFEQDVFISKDAATAFTFQIEDSNGTILGTSTATSSSVSSSADEEGGFFAVDEGSTEEFTFQVNLNPLPADEGKFYRLQVLTIRYNDSAASPDTTYIAEPLNDFETESAVVND